jgi:hypothetical protein
MIADGIRDQGDGFPLCHIVCYGYMPTHSRW